MGLDLESLNGKIAEINIPISVIAEKMGISRQSLYNKLTGRREFKTSEMGKMCTILRLTNEERNTIFFADKVDKIDNF